MAFAQGNTSTTLDDIKSIVSEEAILEYYFGVRHLPCVINSPLRVDRSPSFGLFYTKYGIHYKDLAKGDNGSLYDLLKERFQLKSLAEVLTFISKDLEKIKELDKYIISNSEYRDNPSQTYSKRKSLKTNAALNVKIRQYNNNDLKYWQNFGITQKTLEYGKVFPISHFQIGDSVYRAEEYAYVYVEYKDNIPTIKIYQPFSKKMKWLNNHGSSVWDLWMQAMQSNQKSLIITSSRKDALCLIENIKIPAVSLQAEGYLPKPQVVDILKEKFSNIYCLYDNDYDKDVNYGREHGKKLSELYGFKQIEIPSIYKSKDPSDLFKNVGYFKFNSIINQQIKKELL